MSFWPMALLAVAALCAIRAIIDLRAKRYFWAVLGIAATAVLVMTPIPTHAVVVDLPIENN